MNTGLSENIKSEFSNTINPASARGIGRRVKRGIIQSKIIPDPQWISGFVSLCPKALRPKGGEGNLDVGIKKSKNITSVASGKRTQACIKQQPFKDRPKARGRQELVIKYI